MLPNYVWHPQRSCELLECFIVSSVAKDCLVLPQYDLHHGTFLLVTPIVMSSYKRTIIHCKSTSLWWRAVLSKLCSNSNANSYPPSLCGGCFVCQQTRGHLLWGWRLSLRVATSPKLWAVFCPFYLCTHQ